MARIIVYNEETDLYNIFSNVVDGFFFWESGLTYAQLEKWYVEDAKERALGDLKSTMERVRRTGSSSRIHENLESAIRVNCAGENGAQVDYQTCLDTFLSLEK